MSMFRKPKKIQRRVFSSTLDEDDNIENKIGNDDADDTDLITPPPPPPPQISDVYSKRRKEEKSKMNKKETSNTPKSLLSFADEEDDGETFQVRKSSHSKKVMRMMDKERKRKKKSERDTFSVASTETIDSQIGNIYDLNSDLSNSHNLGSTGGSRSAASPQQRNLNKNDKIQTEIRTDDFVLVVKKSEPDLILNGRAALCAGRDDMSDEDEYGDDENEMVNEDGGRGHRFNKPDHLKQMLESGSIPDAAMIHAARKRRQKARELGDNMPLDETKTETKKTSSGSGRLTNEDLEEDNSDDEERIDMTVSLSAKEREERREQFYSIEKNYSEEDSECETTNEWENQQIRKGVTGAQLVSVQNDTMLSRFMIKSSTAPASDQQLEELPASNSTYQLLQQAYAKCSLEKTQKILSAGKMKEDKTKGKALRTAQEIEDAVSNRLEKVKELNASHREDIERITKEMKALEIERDECKQKAPVVAAKYKFYQEMKCYTTDLVDCLNEKTPSINDLEKRMLHFFAKHHSFLIERRRQDVRDQAKEMAEASKPSTSRTGAEIEEQLRRAAEREGRRTRRRFERERNGLLNSHLDGMSSDDETSDRYQEQFQNHLEQLDKEAIDLIEDVNDEFCKIDLILNRFALWRRTDINSYKDAFVSSCLPKILSPFVRLEILSWSPLLLDYKEMEKFNWFCNCMLYGWTEGETEDALKNDPDVNLVPILIEKIIIPKITEIVTYCWDPLSTTKTLRLIGFISRLGREYPLKESAKNLQNLFNAILDKMKLALDSDVFIPIFPKQVQENKTSFFQRQFCSGLKLFRNFLSWQGIISDKALREMAINSLLNRYLLLALRVCSVNDAVAKAYMIVQTLPTVWLQPESETLKSLQQLILYIKQTIEICDETNPIHMHSIDKAKQILLKLHSL